MCGPSPVLWNETGPGIAYVTYVFPSPQTGSIYFKNLVQKHWCLLTDDEDEDGEEEEEEVARGEKTFTLLDADKAVIRANIVESIIHATQNTRAQLLTALGKITIADYPKRFKELLPKLMGYLNSNDHQALFAALLALYEVVRKYE